jgi:predicted DCC family thiol-disulfide oxidoreductase YuxK
MIILLIILSVALILLTIHLIVPAQKSLSAPVLYFDGVCGLCNAAVDFILLQDKQKIFKFSPLQSDYAAKNLPAHLRENLSTLVLQVDGETYVKSDAVIKIGHLLGGLWRAEATSNALMPKLARDRIYDFIATNRYRWFGKKDSCRLPTPEERTRFYL